MSDVRKDELVRLSVRRELTPEEQSRLEIYFAAHPQARAEWEEERALSRALEALPNVPISTNFTSRVLRELDLRDARERSRSWRISLPRFGWAVAAGLVALFGVHEYRAVKQARLVSALAGVSKDLRSSPSPTVLQDFEVIERLRQTSDDELLIALQ